MGSSIHHTMPFYFGSDHLQLDLPPAPSAAEMLDIVQATNMVHPSLCSTERGMNMSSAAISASLTWAESLKDSEQAFDQVVNISVAWAQVFEELTSSCRESLDSFENVECEALKEGSTWQQLAVGIGNASSAWLAIIEEKADVDHLPAVVKVSEAWADVFFRLRDMQTAVSANAKLSTACSEIEEKHLLELLEQQDETSTEVAAQWLGTLEDLCELDCPDSLRLWSQLSTRAYAPMHLMSQAAEDAQVQLDPLSSVKVESAAPVTPTQSAATTTGSLAPLAIHLKSRAHDLSHDITTLSYDIGCTQGDVAWLGFFTEPDLEVDHQRSAHVTVTSSTFQGRNIVKLHDSEVGVQLCSSGARGLQIAFRGNVGMCRGQAVVVSELDSETVLPVVVPCLAASAKVHGFSLPVSQALPAGAADSRAATMRADDVKSTTTTVTYMIASEGLRTSATATTTSAWGLMPEKLQQMLDTLRALQSTVRQAEHCVDLEDLVKRLVDISDTSVSTFSAEALRPQAWDDGSHAHAVSSAVAETFSVIARQWATRPGCVNAIAGIVSAMQVSTSSWQRVFAVHGSSSKGAARLTSSKWAEAFSAAGKAWKELAVEEAVCSKAPRWAAAMRDVAAKTAAAQSTWASYFETVASEESAAAWTSTWTSFVRGHNAVSGVLSSSCEGSEVPSKQKEAAGKAEAAVSSKLLDAMYELVSDSSLSTWVDMTQSVRVPTGHQWYRCSNDASVDRASAAQRQLLHVHCGGSQS